MGKTVNGINGPFLGRVGTTIGSSWKGIPYIKGPYKRRTKRVSKEEKANRNKFAKAQYWLKPLLEFVRQGFKGHSLKSEGFIAAKSYLLKNSFEGEEINPALVKLSSGDLPLSKDIAIKESGNNQLIFSWDPGYVAGTNNRDQVMLLAYDIDNEDAIYTIAGQFRSAGNDILELSRKKNATYHIYLAFVSADRSRQSESVYMGTVGG